MPSNCTKERIEWNPGAAALAALVVGENLFPTRNRQDVIDMLVIIAVSALKSTPWQPPSFPAGSRYRWPLPADVAALVPGNDVEGG